MTLGPKKVIKKIRRLGHKIEKKITLGQKSLHKVGHHAKKVGRFGERVGYGVGTVGAVTGQPEIGALGAGLIAGSQQLKRGGNYLEKMTE